MGTLNKTTQEIIDILLYLKGLVSTSSDGIQMLDDGQLVTKLIEIYGDGITEPLQNTNWKLEVGTGVDSDFLIFYKRESDAWAEVSRVGIPTTGENVFEIRSESDFPTPSAGVSTLTSGLYILKDAVTLSTITSFECAPNAIIEWTSEDKENHTLITPTTGILFNLADGDRFKIIHASFLLTGNGAKFANLTGSGFNSKFNDFRITFAGTGTTISDTLNTADGTNEWVDGTIVGFQDGITIDNSEGIQIIGLLLASDQVGTGAIINVKRITAIAVNLNSNVFVGGASQSNFYIDPSINVPIQIQDTTNPGNAAFFQSGTTGTFTAVADASIGATAITSVTDSSGIARFNYTGSTVYAGQEVVISGFITNTDYNGTYIITTAGVGYFEVNIISFGSDETGSFLSNSVTLTDTGTTLVDGDTILMDTDLSTDYDKGSIVYNKQTNSVQVNATWVATETGTWDTGSLTEDSRYINSVGNGAQEDSKSISSVFVSANTDTTSITGIGTWDSLDLGSATASEGQSASRFKMIDSVTGEVEYVGLNDFSGTLTVNISALKAGGAVDYKFRAFKTVGGDPFDIITISRAITTVKGALGLTQSIKVSPGDRLRIEVQTLGATNDITISDFSFVIH